MKVSNVSKSHILKNISLDFDEKGIVFVKGKSGAGKTTLFNVMSGIDNDYTGYVNYESSNQRDAEWYRRNCLGIIFQDFNLIDSLNVRENIFLGCDVAGKRVDLNQYEEIVSLLDIESIQEREISFLSGGEKQRVAIAREFLRNDGIVFADEPSGNLDEENTRLLFDYIKKLSDKILFIIITHDIQIAEKYGDRIIEINDGKIVSDLKINNNERLEIKIEKTSKSKKWMLKYSLRSIIYRKRKYIGICMISIFAIICLMLIMGFVNTTNKINTTIKSDYLENDKYTVWKQQDNGFAEKLSDEDIKSLNKLNNIKKINFFYERNVDVIYNDETINIQYETYTDDVFFEKRFLLDEKKIGKYKVVIDENLSDIFFGQNSAIGKKIQIALSEQNVIDVEVAGVKNSTSSKNGEIYISRELEKEICLGEYERDVIVYSLQDDFGNVVTQGAINNDSDILVGRNTNNSDEITISYGLVNIFLQEILQDNSLYSEKEIIEGDVNEPLTEKIIGREVDISFSMGNTKIGTKKIVGIVNDKEQMNVYFDKTISNEIVYNKCSLYLSEFDIKQVNNIEKNIADIGLKCNKWSKGKSQVITTKISGIIFVMTILALVVSAFCVVVIHFFMKMSILERKYEIGVLRALGNGKKEICMLLSIEQFTAAMVTGIISIIVIMLSCLLGILDKIKIDNIPIYSFEWVHIIYVFLFTIVLLVLFSLPDIHKTSKENIVDLLTGM